MKFSTPLLVVGAASSLMALSIAFAAGNSGSTGTRMDSTLPTSRDSSTLDSATSMDDHSDSALNRQQQQQQLPGPRTSKNTADQDTSLGRGAGTDSHTDTESGTSSY